MITLHIDGDILLYRCGFAVEKRVVTQTEEGTESHLEIGTTAEGIEYLDSVISFIRSLVAHDHYKIYLSGDKNYRKNVATILEYKGNRKRSRKPVHYDALKTHIVNEHPYEYVQGQEADDALGIALTRDGDSAIVASSDKDLLMIPGKHLILKHKLEESHLVTISEDQGRHNFWLQMLEGDKTTDNIMGCPQVGKKRARKHLEHLKGKSDLDYWRVVRRVYLEQFKARPPEGFRLEGETVFYPSWRTGAEMSKNIDEYLTEIGQLLYIRKTPMEMWFPPKGD